MTLRTALTAVLLIGVAETSSAQEARLDSLIAAWMDRGPIMSWQPYELFEGCPRLEAWQERGIGILLTADLPPQRVNDLAHAWRVPLQQCDDARLERWYYERLRENLSRGEPDAMLGIWMALEHADSPGLRQYLRQLMLTADLPASAREGAGAYLFAKLDAEERMREYLQAFQTLQLPEVVASAQTAMLLQKSPSRLLREVGRLVELRPELADQSAFTAVVEFSPRYASAADRRRLGRILQAALNGAGATIAGRRRVRLEAAAEYLLSPE